MDKAVVVRDGDDDGHGRVAKPVFDGLLLAADNTRSASESLRAFGPSLSGLTDDWMAARQFLDEYTKSPRTRRRYETEVLRLFYWAGSQHKAVSALRRPDYDAYAEFLADPQPASIWCGPRRPKSDPRWRPFVGGLAPESVHHALTIIQSMLSYWVQDGYLLGNPLALKRLKRARSNTEQPTANHEHDAGQFERYFDDQSRQAIETALAAMPRNTHRERAQAWQLRWIYQLLASTGCRITEVANATHNDLIQFDEGWWLRVIGKGDKPRSIPLAPALIDDLMAYRQFHGLPPLPLPDETTPLLPPLYLKDRRGQARSGIRPRRAHTLLKDLFEQAALELTKSAPAKAERLRQGSAHWFRHTFVSRLVNQNVPVRSIMDTTGHSDERTFRKYNHRLREERYQDVVSKIHDED